METVRIPSQLNLNSKNLDASWRKFRLNFEIYLQARGIKQGGDNQVALFLNVAGEEAVALATRLGLSVENDLSEIMAVFQNHCCPKHSEIRERHRFYTRNQLADEPFQEYLKVLNDLVQSCNFPDPKAMMRDRIVVGINNDTLRRTLLDVPTLNYETAIQLCSAALYDKEIKAPFSAGCEKFGIEENTNSVLELDSNYCLACFAPENLIMGQHDNFQRFSKSLGCADQLPQLRAQNAKVGEVAILPYYNRFVYYLLVKTDYNSTRNDVAQLGHLFESLKRVREHMLSNHLTCLGVSELGRDYNFKWREVKDLLQSVFEGTNIRVTACSGRVVCLSRIGD